jgi:hypothetical protein
MDRYTDSGMGKNAGRWLDTEVDEKFDICRELDTFWRKQLSPSSGNLIGMS